MALLNHARWHYRHPVKIQYRMAKRCTECALWFGIRRGIVSVGKS
jgi:hypothetical protein